MNTAKLIAWLVLPLVGLVLAGMLAIWVFKALLGMLVYIVVGALVVGGGVYLYKRAQRSLDSGRARRRIAAASQTYRMRNR
jgi:hypothetical protein